MREPGASRVLTGFLVWSGVVLATLAGMLAAFPALPANVVAALAAGAAPGVLAQGLHLRNAPRTRLALIAAWALCGGLGAVLTGGLAGPLAAWCAAPLVAAAALDRRKLVSGAAALSLVAAALALWTSLTRGGLTPPAPVALWLSFLSVGTVVAGLGAALSVSMRRRGDRAERGEDAARRLESLLADQPHLILTLDTAGRVGSAFGAAPPGVPADVLFAHGLIAAAHHPDRPALQTALLRAADHGSADAGFSPRAALDRWVELSVRRAGGGRLIATLRDATVQHARETALEAARAEAESLNAGKSRFLANMSHELRTPLNAVIGFSDIMRQRLFGPLPERYAEYAQLIHESGGHLLDLINDVLDMSKIEAARYELHRESFDAREAVSAALRLVRLQAHEAGISMRGLLPADPVTVDADRRALKQITLNLLSNALKFTPAGGAVTVTLQADGPMLELLVADTGVGVAPEDLKRLGRPFEQVGDAGRKAMGTGLGLSLVRAFAELHGGSMAIESALGEGTAVTVRLPVVSVQDAQPRSGAEIIPLPLQR
jgi:cell cycle sensor histidine kinase DivJ